MISFRSPLLRESLRPVYHQTLSAWEALKELKFEAREVEWCRKTSWLRSNKEFEFFKAFWKTKNLYAIFFVTRRLFVLPDKLHSSFLESYANIFCSSNNAWWYTGHLFSFPPLTEMFHFSGSDLLMSPLTKRYFGITQSRFPHWEISGS